MRKLLDLPTELRLLIWAHLYDILVEERGREGHGIGPLDISWDAYDTVYDRSSTRQLRRNPSISYLVHPLAASETIHIEALPYAVSAMQRLSVRPRAIVNFQALEDPILSSTNSDVLSTPLGSLRLSERWQLRINIFPIDSDSNEVLIQRINRFSSAVFSSCAPKVIELCVQPPEQKLSLVAMQKLLRALCSLRATSFHVHVGNFADTEMSEETLEALLLSPTKA